MFYRTEKWCGLRTVYERICIASALFITIGLGIRDRNRTEPEPNRTELSGWTNRTELDLSVVGSFPTVTTIDFWENC